MDCNDKQIGRNIKAIRNANKKDYYEFATAINISEDLLKKIESGGRHATDQTIQKISEITGISFSSIKYKDLSYLEKGEFCLDEDLTFHELSEVDELKELNFRLLKLQFPIMEDKEALESDEFIAGIKIAHNSIETCDFTPKECIDAINHFIRSSDNPNCANLAAINILSCFGYLYTFTVISLVSEDKVPKLLKERITSLTDYWCAIRSSLSTKNIKIYPLFVSFLCDGDNNLEGLNGGKYPICSWNTDVYTNWLTQNGINIATNIISGAVQGVSGGLSMAFTGSTMGGGNVVSGLTQIFNTAGEVYKHSLQPPQAEGNINSGDVTYASGHLTFTAYQMSIKLEYARIIDGYFDMYGYKINQVKLPNKAHRGRWWFTKLINPNIDGAIPNKDMQLIKDCYSRGITFWRNAEEIQNYNLDNNIV